MEISTAERKLSNESNDWNRPHIPPKSHPILTGKYLIPTPAIDDLYETVNTWLENRTPGGIVYGRPRLGKTRAIRYLLTELGESEGTQLPVFHMECRHYSKASEQTFFEDLLRSVGHGIVFSGTVSAKRQRLIEFLVEQAMLSGVNRIVLIIDEAQNLHRAHYEWLMDVYNELDEREVFMSVILVGQEELIHQRSAFIASSKAQIVGRFMLRTYKFQGIKTLDDLRTCLESFDEHSEFPIGSGWSFTRYFFPDAFRGGLRLSSYAGDILEVFQELRKEHGISQPFEIPMQYFTSTVEYCLKRFGVDGEDVHRLTKTHWRQAVEQSGYVESEMYQAILGKDVKNR